ncbi:thioredoxin-like protein [Piptocephalis cylindrospora]|uniref:Thioredoxin-like protein n=1 Tax=Piptocephalis cylindrospora TaxID=1907219 RepID=A0A4P9Y4G7_9FUNG|nr:thioredoxin-like protein [Piptocephalis cylindrospora]|eukprot:RKP13753.1 thioredoxin-like protein [Piptocephalis cylindrospora]
MSTEEEVHWLIQQHPVLVFSKTYCFWSTLAKDILNTYPTMSPLYHVIEVDLRPDMADMKRVLGRETGRFTFPNVFIKGVSVGGGTNVQALQESGKLKGLLSDAGVLE